MTETIPTNHGPATPEDVVDYLTYCCYKFNRDMSPHISPEEWARIFSNVPAMEEQYLRERAIEGGVQ